MLSIALIRLQTKSGDDKDVIVDKALRQITGLDVSYFQPENSAKRVLLFYKFIFRRYPIVVLRVPERLKNQNYADVPSAVRTLADEFGLRVIVDGSPNSIPPELLSTKRQTVMVVELMSRELLESIPEFASFIALLKAHKLDDPVWNVLGGSPIEYSKLREKLITYLFLPLPFTASSSDEVVDEVKRILTSILTVALNEDILDSSSNTKAIVKVFQDKKGMNLSKTDLEEKKMHLEYPNKVFS